MVPVEKDDPPIWELPNMLGNLESRETYVDSFLAVYKWYLDNRMQPPKLARLFSEVQRTYIQSYE